MRRTPHHITGWSGDAEMSAFGSLPRGLVGNKLARNPPHRGPRRLGKKSPLAGPTSSESQELIRHVRIEQFLVGDDDPSLEEKMLFSILNFVRRGNLPTLEG